MSVFSREFKSEEFNRAYRLLGLDRVALPCSLLQPDDVNCLYESLGVLDRITMGELWPPHQERLNALLAPREMKAL